MNAKTLLPIVLLATQATETQKEVHLHAHSHIEAPLQNSHIVIRVYGEITRL
jgi:hypothetical protein